MRTKRPARAVSEFRYSPLVAALTVALAPQAAMAVVKTVTDPSDASSPGTLRDALNYFSDFENCTGSDRIEFQSNGPFTTTVSSPLPFINCGGLTIDGSVMPSGERALILGTLGTGGPTYGLSGQNATAINVVDLEIANFGNGAALDGNINALRNVIRNNLYGYDPSGYSNVTASDNTFQNNVHGIRLSGNSNVTITANDVRDSSSRGIFVYGGTNINISGNTVSANRTGIHVSYGGSTVSIDTNEITFNVDSEVHDGVGIYLEGSSASVNNNLISGNDYAVYIEADEGSKITTNRIGVTNDGAEPFGNLSAIVFGATSGNLSSGTEISGNVISANNAYGIDLSEFDNVKISGNKIGTSLDGTNGMGNGLGGILAYCGNAIEVSGNVISGNNGNGIEFWAVQGGGALNIVGNKIGVQGNGITALGNSSYGVVLYTASCGEDFEEHLAKAKGKGGRKGLKSVGGTNDLLIRSNSIANNSRDGVLVAGGTGNKIVENDIYANGGKNINLGTPGGPRGNDGGDADGGPNNGQNHPVIASVARDWPNARSVVNFTLDTIPGSYRIDVYSNASSAGPAGRIWHGSMSFTAGTGPTAGTIFVAGLSASNQPNNFTLTATAPFDNGSDATRGDTSEFSDSAFLASTQAVTITPNPPNLNFGQVPVDSVSPPQVIRLLSSGNAPYTLTRMGLNTCSGGSFYGGPFMISNTCRGGHTYAPGEFCEITARFAPISTGPQTLTIGECDTTFTYGSRTFTLTGTGATPPPVAIVPSEFDFGEVLAGSRSEPQVFAINNPSSSAVAIGPVTVSSGEFAIDSTTCGSSIPAGGSCAASVAFQPSQPQRFTATLAVSASSSETPGSGPAVKIRRVKADSGSATAFLSGQGTQRADITLPSSIDFGAYTIGTPALRQSVVIENVGNAIVSFNNISVTGPFVIGNGCPLNIAPGERCTVTLDFSTTTVGDFTGALFVVSNAAGGTRTIPLTARSIAAPAAQLQVSPNTLSFGDRLLGTTSASQRVTIRNTGNLPAAITSITTTSDYVILGNTCTLALAPSSTCFADVALRPAGFGPRPGSLFVNSDVPGSPNVVGLGGTGCRPFSSSSSRFGVGSGFNCAP
jgi:parallel beta-helix repeat protein